MTSTYRLIFPAAVLALFLLASCGSGNGKLTTQGAAPVAPPDHAFMPGLPLPSLLATEYPGPRAISFSELDLTKPGWLYEHNMPNQNVSDANQPLASYGPSFNPQAPSLAGLAYAIYRFDAEDYDRAAVLRLTWDSAPAEREDVWIALSDWDSNRWDYFQADSNWRVNFGETTRYMKDGRLLLAAIILTGESAAELTSLRLGQAPPIAAVSVSPQSGTPPLSVSFDATASTAGEGTITKYEWDFDLDGNYELDSGTDAVVEHDYAQGVHQARLRVTNTAGISATVLSAPIKVDSNWQHSYGRAFSDYVSDVFVDVDGNIFICGGSDDTDEEDNLTCGLLCKLNQQGELLWARGYRNTGNAFYTSLTSEPGGTILCGGQHQPGGGADARALVQRWSADGDLLLSRECQRGSPIYPEEILSLSGAIVLAGMTIGAASSYDVFCALLNQDGEIVWTRTEGTNSTDYARGAVLLSDPFNPPFGIAVGGYRFDSPMLSVFTMEGQPDIVQTVATNALDGEIAYVHKILYLDDGFNPSTFIFSGNIILEGDGRDAFILGMPMQGDSSVGRRFHGPIQSYELALDGQGNLLVGGYSSDGTARGWLGRFELPELTSRGYFSFSGSDNAVLRALAVLPDGVLICGNAPNASLVRADAAVQGTVFEGSWEALSTSGISNDCSMLISSGEVFDLAPLLTVDSGGGGDDAYVALTQLPE